jgi:Fe-S cluster biogenesis protein NfuA
MAQPFRKGRVSLGSVIVSIFVLLIVLFAILILLVVAYYIFFAGPDIFFAPPSAREISISGRGPLVDSQINFYILNDDGTKGALAGNATSGSDGVYFATVNAAQGDFLLAEAANGTYADGVNKTRRMKHSEVLTAAASAETDDILMTITPLTHMAATRARALAANSTPLSTAVPSANIGVARQYGLVDIIQIQPILPDDEDWLSSADMDERNYALVLAGISTEAETLDVSTVGLADALADDASDGILDGKDSGEPISMDTLSDSSARLDPGAGIAGVQNGIAAAPVAPNIKPNQANLAIPLQPVPLGINGAGKFYITSTMPPAAFAGDVYNVQLTAQGGTPPYTCSLAPKNADLTVSAPPDWLQLGADCTLRGNVPPLVGGNTMTISQPFTVLMCDSANECGAFEIRITVIGQKPEIATHEARCFVNEFCNENIATADGGQPPYHFRSDYLREGPTPMGTIVGLNGNIRGTPTVMGTYSVGVCAIDMIGAYSCGHATVRVVSSNATLYLKKTGSGTGKVYANPYNKDNVYANGVTVTLTATADSGSTFIGWGGDCEGAASDKCTLLMNGDKSVEAQFDSNGSSNATLYLKKTGSGTGKVYANPYNKDNVYANGVTVTLTATADSGSTFMGWGGDCEGASSSKCTLLMNGDKDVEAQFDSSGQQPSGEISVKIDTGRCGAANGEVYGPVGTELMVYYGSGHGTGYPVSSINCGKWTPGPDTQYQCQRGDNDPYGTGWAALTCQSCSYGGSISAVVYAPSSYVLILGADNMMEEANANFPCR